MDMCMCEDHLCVKFKDCYRVMGTPNPCGQSCFGEIIPKLEDGSCEYFIHNWVNLTANGKILDDNL